MRELQWSQASRLLIHNWGQGQHLLIIAKNGSGKTYLLFRLMAYMAYVKHAYSVSIITKPRDATIMQGILQMPKVKIVETASEIKPALKKGYQSIFLRPYTDNFSTFADVQKEQISQALQELWLEGDVLINIEELRYLSDQLGLGDEIILLFTQGRSSGITLAGTMQRPRWVPIEVKTESRFIIVGTITSRDDKKYLTGIIPDSDIELLTTLPYRWFYVYDSRGEFEPFITIIAA